MGKLWCAVTSGAPGLSRRRSSRSVLNRSSAVVRSTSVVALPLPDHSGWIVDTPGIRSFGIAHVDPDNVLHGFPELVEASANCPPNCDHMGLAGDCGLNALVAAGKADPRRVASYRRLLASRTGSASPDRDEARDHEPGASGPPGS